MSTHEMIIFNFSLNNEHVWWTKKSVCLVVSFSCWFDQMLKTQITLGVISIKWLPIGPPRWGAAGRGRPRGSIWLLHHQNGLLPEVWPPYKSHTIDTVYHLHADTRRSNNRHLHHTALHLIYLIASENMIGEIWAGQDFEHNKGYHEDFKG